ncbi:MAG: hypothetical protein IKR85_08460 [Clostridia bacterium]|nr:hypothetical protein [Clostridia bacterium]
MKKAIILICAFALLASALVALCEEACEHKWSAYSVVNEPTCTSEGLEIRVCEKCGATETEILAKTDHSYSAWQKQTDVYHTRTCSVCGDTQREEHDSTIHKDVTTARVNCLGKRDCTCAKCGYTYRRYISVYEKLYPMTGTDVLGDGSAYIKVNTVNLAAGSSKPITLYSDAKYELFASTDSTLLIYANAANGRFTGIELTNGSAVVSVSGGSAELDFAISSGKAELSAELGEDVKYLRLTNKSGQFVQASVAPAGQTKYLAYVTKSTLDGNYLSGEMRAYSSASPRIVLSGKGKSFSAQLKDGSQYSNAYWSYNGKNGGINCQASAGKIVVMSAGKALFDGAEGGTMTESEAAGGWYISISDNTLAYASPVYAYDGSLLDKTPEEADAHVPDSGETDGDTDTQSADTEISEPQTVKLLYYTEGYAGEIGSSPKVSISYDGDGHITVRASNTPANTTFAYIRLTQNYTGGMKILNAYTAEAEFELLRYESDVTISVVYKDKAGTEKAASSISYRLLPFT